MQKTTLEQDAIDNGRPDDSVATPSATKTSANPLVAGGAVLLGAGLAYAAIKVIKNSAKDRSVAKDVHVETSVTINKSPSELYAFWRDFRNLPKFSKYLESVSVLQGTNRTHWIAVAPQGSKIEWDAEIFNEKENELIAWRSLKPDQFTNAGSVRFQKAPGGRGTFVRVALNYNNPAGQAGVWLAEILKSEPGQLIKEDLQRLKQLMEAGEIASVNGQSSGRASEA